MPCSRALKSPRRWLVPCAACSGPVDLLSPRLCRSNASLDLVVLPHTLELSVDPHMALREVERVLVPEGRVVIAGLNPEPVGPAADACTAVPALDTGTCICPMWGVHRCSAHARLAAFVELRGRDRPLWLLSSSSAQPNGWSAFRGLIPGREVVAHSGAGYFWWPSSVCMACVCWSPHGARAASGWLPRCRWRASLGRMAPCGRADYPGGAARRAQASGALF